MAYLQRELARQKKRVTNHTVRLDELVEHLIAVETFIDGLKRRMDNEELTFKAKPLSRGAGENVD